jgi:hypothetical protein
VRKHLSESPRRPRLRSRHDLCRALGITVAFVVTAFAPACTHTADFPKPRSSALPQAFISKADSICFEAHRRAAHMANVDPRSPHASARSRQSIEILDGAIGQLSRLAPPHKRREYHAWIQSVRQALTELNRATTVLLAAQRDVLRSFPKHLRADDRTLFNRVGARIRAQNRRIARLDEAIRRDIAEAQRRGRRLGLEACADFPV